MKSVLVPLFGLLLLSCGGGGGSSDVAPADPAPPIAVNPFGVSESFPQFATEIRQAGAGLARVVLSWRQIEPVKDRYDWTFLDALVDRAQLEGIDILGDFMSTPAWAQRDPTLDMGVGVAAIKDMNEFRQFTQDVAARYRGRLTCFEILNEVTFPMFFRPDPDQPYENWLIAGYEGVRAGNPDAQVAIGGFVNPLDAPVFVDYMLENFSAYYDIVNFHIYATESDVTRACQFIKGRMQAFGVDKPLWITETATKAFDSQSDLQKLAEDVIKRCVRAVGEGVDRVLWWKTHDLPLPSEWSGAGTTTWTTGLGWDYPKDSGQPSQFHPRQAYFTYTLMTSKLSPCSAVAKLGDTQYRFAVGGRRVYVLWGSGGAPAEITGTVTVTDHLGNAQVLDAASIVLDESPIFVEAT